MSKTAKLAVAIVLGSLVFLGLLVCVFSEMAFQAAWQLDLTRSAQEVGWFRTTNGRFPVNLGQVLDDPSRPNHGAAILTRSDASTVREIDLFQFRSLGADGFQIWFTELGLTSRSLARSRCRETWHRWLTTCGVHSIRPALNWGAADSVIGRLAG